MNHCGGFLDLHQCGVSSRVEGVSKPAELETAPAPLRAARNLKETEA
jgi:hypothetical protein